MKVSALLQLAALSMQPMSTVDAAADVDAPLVLCVLYLFVLMPALLSVSLMYLLIVFLDKCPCGWWGLMINFVFCLRGRVRVM